MKKDLIITRVVAAVLAFAMFATQLSENMPVFYVCAEGEDETEYSIEHKVNSSWDGGCNSEITLKNLSNHSIKDWSISFSTMDEITDLWGGVITEYREVYDEKTPTGLQFNYRYTVKAESYNASVPSGAQVNIGYSAIGDIHDIWDTEAMLIFNGTGTDSGHDVEENISPIGGTYIGEDYTVEVIISDIWEGAYNVKIQIRNTSVEKIHNWGLVMKTNDRISGLYNAVELSEKDGLHMIKNMGYDQDIPVGGSVEVGYTAFYEEYADAPQEFALSQIKKEVDMDGCIVSLFTTNEWEDGGMAQIIIENTSDSVIEDWMLEFDSIMEIVDLWGGVIESHEGEHYFIRNADYAQNIAVGETLAVEIVFNGDAADIRNIKVSQIVAGDMDNEADVTPSPTPFADEEDTDYVTDTDGDGIPDAYEEIIGTDCILTDTDSDGLDDYVEVFVLGSNPLVYDSIESGVADSDADSDGDGISNLQEINMGLNPALKDADYDGLDDGDEINRYGTDAKNEDTDGDGLKDGEEVRLGLDPLRMCTYEGDDNQYRVQQTIKKESKAFIRINKKNNPYRFSMDIVAAGFVEDNIDVYEPMEAAVIQNDAMIGMPLYMYYDRAESIESVTLRFEINEEYAIDKSASYPDISELQGIHRYNIFHYIDDMHILLPVETFFDEENNTVYAKTDELGTYCLMDMEKVFDRLNSLSELKAEIDDNAGRSILEISQQAETAEVQMTALEFAKEMSGVVAGKQDGVSDIPVTKALPEGDGRKLVNLYFILFRAGESDWIYEKERNLIPDVLEKLQNNNKDYRFRAIVLFHDNCWASYHAGELNWYEDPDELRAMIMERDHYSHYNGYLDYDDPGSILHGLLKEQIRDNPESLNYAYNCTSTHMMYSRHISRPYSIYEEFAGKVVYSDIGKYYFLYEDYDETSQYPTFVEKTGGVRWICEGDMVSKVYEHIMGTMPEVTEGGEGGDMPIPSGGEGGENGEDDPEDTKPDTRMEYPAITLTGWNIIKLAAPLTEGSNTDTDEDGITDWDEVDTRLLTVKNGKYVLPTINDCINDVDKPYVRDGMKRFGKSLSMGEDSLEDLIQHYKTARILPIISDPTSIDSDGDGIKDDIDDSPLVSDMIMVNIPNIYDIDYLNVDGKDGGDQGWWGNYEKDNDLFYRSRDYRMGKCGCGVIAMTDLEIYLTQQNDGYHALNQTINYRNNDGFISRDDYMDYANYNIDNVYCLGPNPIANIVGVNPGYMRFGIEMFLCENKSEYKSAAWAPSYTKYGVISRIETMISEGLPVVFAYHAPDDPLFMYDSIEAAKIMADNSSINSCDDHYMTVLGCVRYIRDNGEIGYILKIISWGDIYYINYDQYSEKIGLFTNILEII